MFKFQNFKTHSENFQPGKTDSKIAIRTSQKQLFSFYSTIDLFYTSRYYTNVQLILIRSKLI